VCVGLGVNVLVTVNVAVRVTIGGRRVSGSAGLGDLTESGSSVGVPGSVSEQAITNANAPLNTIASTTIPNRP